MCDEGSRRRQQRHTYILPLCIVQAAVTRHDIRTSYVSRRAAAKGVDERGKRSVQWALLLVPSHGRTARICSLPARMYTSLQAPQTATIGRSSLPHGMIDGNLAPLHGIRVIRPQLKVDTCSRSFAAEGLLPR